ncbi:MAG: 1-acyl-sn-glycerol-3-phosphate acyltransferase [Candidatus Delongbacteria bacterium]|nr:1-acyl-sn-glycerol-3-phosphate acyltransferase [Candidatus Delongbacteria bacterium]
MKQVLLYTSKFLMFVFLRLFFKLEISGRERIPARGRLILAPNHQSNWDPPLVGIAATRQVCFAAKKQLFEPLPQRLLLTLLNTIPLDRHGLDRHSLRRMETVLDRGGALVLFPEGTRSTTGELGRGRDGIGLLALQTQADLLPVYLDGTRGAWPRCWRRHCLRLRFGELIAIAPFLEASEPRRQVIRRLSEQVMNGIRKEQEAMMGAPTDETSVSQ